MVRYIDQGKGVLICFKMMWKSRALTCVCEFLLEYSILKLKILAISSNSWSTQYFMSWFAINKWPNIPILCHMVQTQRTIPILMIFKITEICLLAFRLGNITPSFIRKCFTSKLMVMGSGNFIWPVPC